MTRAVSGREVAHAHRQAELLVVLEGDASLEVDGSVVGLASGSGAVLAPMTRHAIRAGATGSPKTLGLLFDAAWLETTCGLDGAALPAFAPIADAAVAAARQVAELLERSPPHASQALGQAVTALGCQGLARVAAQARCPDATQRLDRRLARSLDRMPQALAARTPIESIARHIGLSRPHFFKLFQQALNVTPALYLNMLRIEHAIREMTETDRPVGRVAGDLGFTAQANFTRFFRGIEGMSPSEYRRAAAAWA